MEMDREKYLVAYGLKSGAYLIPVFSFIVFFHIRRITHLQLPDITGTKES